MDFQVETDPLTVRRSQAGLLRLTSSCRGGASVLSGGREWGQAARGVERHMCLPRRSSPSRTRALGRPGCVRHVGLELRVTTQNDCRT